LTINSDAKYYRSGWVTGILLVVLVVPGQAIAEADWWSFTFDNDIFVGTDDGYTNGLYLSWYDTEENSRPKPGILASWMMWAMPDAGNRSPVTETAVRSIGQTMITPEDITLEDPPLPPEDLPYAGLLFFSDSYVRAYRDRADRVSSVIGVVGEYSFAEQTQKFVHKITGSDEPKGWDTQLDDELVFQFGLGSIWRSWVSPGGNADLLLGADAAIGTISSNLGAIAMIRYGEGLERNFANTVMLGQRVSNPVSSNEGWYLFGGIGARYVANQIFLDGNTYDDDAESIDYDQGTVPVMLGIAYSWDNLSFTFAVNDLNAIENDGNDVARDYSRYGSFTLAWRGY
jgi:hypothetical protein